MGLRSRLLKADVQQSLAESRPDQRAEQRLRGGAGVYNIHPASFLIGILGAVFAALFALYTASRWQDPKLTPPKQSATSPGSASTGPQPALADDPIWIEVE
jgi:hypothetical protein